MGKDRSNSLLFRKPPKCIYAFVPVKREHASPHNGAHPKTFRAESVSPFPHRGARVGLPVVRAGSFSWVAFPPGTLSFLKKGH